MFSSSSLSSLSPGTIPSLYSPVYAPAAPAESDSGSESESGTESVKFPLSEPAASTVPRSSTFVQLAGSKAEQTLSTKQTVVNFWQGKYFFPSRLFALPLREAHLAPHFC